MAVYDTVLPALPFLALLSSYSASEGCGTRAGRFHVWRSLRFQNAIWHACVLVAAACHWGVVLHTVVC